MVWGTKKPIAALLPERVGENEIRRVLVEDAPVVGYLRWDAGKVAGRRRAGWPERVTLYMTLSADGAWSRVCATRFVNA